MSEETEPTTIKTETDLKLEALEKQMGEMKAAYESQIAEMKEANQALWAALHPATEGEPPAEPTEDAYSKAYEIIEKKLGVKIQ